MKLGTYRSQHSRGGGGGGGGVLSESSRQPPEFNKRVLTPGKYTESISILSFPVWLEGPRNSIIPDSSLSPLKVWEEMGVGAGGGGPYMQTKPLSQ